MRIGLINEGSQANKNGVIFEALEKVANKYNHTVINFGMLDENDTNLIYVQAGLLSSILLETKVVDLVITGCGTGQGAMMSLNSYPNIMCGLVADPLDAYLFGQINAGNAISIPYAKGYAGVVNLI